MENRSDENTSPLNKSTPLVKSIKTSICSTHRNGEYHLFGLEINTLEINIDDTGTKDSSVAITDASRPETALAFGKLPYTKARKFTTTAQISVRKLATSLATLPFTTGLYAIRKSTYSQSELHKSELGSIYLDLWLADHESYPNCCHYSSRHHASLLHCGVGPISYACTYRHYRTLRSSPVIR